MVYGSALTDVLYVQLISVISSFVWQGLDMFIIDTLFIQYMIIVSDL